MADSTTSTRSRAQNNPSVADQIEDEVRDATSSRSTSSSEDSVTQKLKSVGVDTDVMTSAAKDQASELQRLLSEELRAHPMRTLGIAAAVGLFVGLLTAR